jgi:hypothetical protein
VTEGNSGNRWLVAFAGFAVALGLWFAVALGREAPESEGRAEAGLPARSSAPQTDPGLQPPATGVADEPVMDGPLPPAAPANRITEGGRLSIDATSLRDGDVLALGLGLPEEAQGEEPLSVRIVSVDGRRLETTAVPAAGSESGLRLEIDPKWLAPGSYMIEVRTAEKTHFPIRRYVLEVSPTAP